MCTLAFSLQKEGLQLAFNRDEVADRAVAYTPQFVDNAEIRILAPIDPVGSGTWIGANNAGVIACLMNHRHFENKYTLSYLRSRGQLIMDILSLTPTDYINFIEKQGKNFAPFHVFVFSDAQKFRVTWNGQEMHFFSIEDGNYTFSSTTLYNTQDSAQRQDAWKRQSSEGVNDQTLDDFLQQCRIAKYINPLGKEVHTVSYTTLTTSKKSIRLQYKNLYPQLSELSTYELSL